MRMAVSQMKAFPLYLGLVFAVSPVFYALIIASGHVDGGDGRYGTGLDWCPAAAALLTCTLLRIDIGAIGWRWRPWRWQILDGESTMLAKKGDPRSVKVFDPSIKGETDRFAYRFVKP